MACLDDALLLGVLGLLRAPDLARLAATSRALYCFAYHEPLWKALALQVLAWSMRSHSIVDVPPTFPAQMAQINDGFLPLHSGGYHTHVSFADGHCLDQQELEDFTYSVSWRETHIKGSVQHGFQQVNPLQVLKHALLQLHTSTV